MGGRAGEGRAGRLLPGAAAGRAGARRSPQVRGGRAGVGRGGPLAFAAGAPRDGAASEERAEGRRGAGGWMAKGATRSPVGRGEVPTAPAPRPRAGAPPARPLPGGRRGFGLAVVGLRRRDRRQKAPAGRGASGFCPQQGS